MKHHRGVVWSISLIAFLILPGTTCVVSAQGAAGDSQFSGGVLGRSKAEITAAKQMSASPHNPTIPYSCSGRVLQKTDVAFEGVKITTANWANPANGGGETGRFDKVPILSTRVRLRGGCLNAHVSAIVGSKKTYGLFFNVSSITFFQVTLTAAGTVNHQHMIGHYDMPYNQYGPAVMLEAENDVDMYASNFFQPVGIAKGSVPPGDYTVDWWWAGGPIGGGGAIGAAFVLSLYQM